MLEESIAAVIGGEKDDGALKPKVVVCSPWSRNHLQGATYRTRSP